MECAGLPAGLQQEYSGFSGEKIEAAKRDSVVVVLVAQCGSIEFSPPPAGSSFGLSAVKAQI